MKTKTVAAIFAAMPLALKLGYMLIKFLTGIFVGAGLLTLFACQRSSIFDAKPKEPINNPLLGSSGETAMAVEVHATLQSAPKTMSIETNGFVRYIDAARFAGQITSAFSAQEYGDWVALFLEQDVLHLENRYEGSAAFGTPSYRITFKHGGLEKNITTDSVSAPTNVQKILRRFAEEMALLREQALTLAFTVSRDTLAMNEETQLQLIVSNAHAHAVPVRAGETLVEFFVITPAQFAESERAFDAFAPVIWSERQSASALHATQNFQLAPGAQRTYSTKWNGRNHHGVWLAGSYVVAARLATTPGGISLPRKIYVKAQ